MINLLFVILSCLGLLAIVHAIVFMCCFGKTLIRINRIRRFITKYPDKISVRFEFDFIDELFNYYGPPPMIICEKYAFTLSTNHLILMKRDDDGDYRRVGSGIPHALFNDWSLKLTSSGMVPIFEMVYMRSYTKLKEYHSTIKDVMEL